MITHCRGGSSAGRASRSQCEGREFDPPPLHQRFGSQAFRLAFFLPRPPLLARVRGLMRCLAAGRGVPLPAVPPRPASLFSIRPVADRCTAGRQINDLRAVVRGQRRRPAQSRTRPCDRTTAPDRPKTRAPRCSSARSGSTYAAACRPAAPAPRRATTVA